MGILTDRAIRLATSVLNPLPDRPGELARLTGRIAEQGVNIHSLLSYPEDEKTVRAVVRVDTLETHHLAEALRQSGMDVVWPPRKPW